MLWLGQDSIRTPQIPMRTHTSSRHLNWECCDWGQDSMRTPVIPARTHSRGNLPTAPRKPLISRRPFFPPQWFRHPPSLRAWPCVKYFYTQPYNSALLSLAYSLSDSQRSEANPSAPTPALVKTAWCPHLIVFCKTASLSSRSIKFAARPPSHIPPIFLTSSWTSEHKIRK